MMAGDPDFVLTPVVLIGTERQRSNSLARSNCLQKEQMLYSCLFPYAFQFLSVLGFNGSIFVNLIDHSHYLKFHQIILAPYEV